MGGEQKMISLAVKSLVVVLKMSLIMVCEVSGVKMKMMMTTNQRPSLWVLMAVVENEVLS